MTYRAHMNNGQVVFDEIAQIDDGALLEIVVLNRAPEKKEHRPIWEVVRELSAQVPDEEWEMLPTDGASNVDHYLYGHPKNDE